MSEDTAIIENDLAESELFDSNKLLSALNENNPETIKLFLDKNIFSDYTDDEENSLVHIAVANKNKKSLAALLEHGLNPNQFNSEHLTPLHLAVMQKDLKAAKLLLKFGAKKDAADNNGKTAICHAEENKFESFLEVASKIKAAPIQQERHVDNEKFIQELLVKIKETKDGGIDIDNILKNIVDICDRNLLIPQSHLRDEIKSIKKHVKLLTHKLFSNLENIDKLPEAESLKILRKFLSILNSVLMANLSKKNSTDEIQKLSKLENFLEDKIIKSNTNTEYLVKETNIVIKQPSTSDSIKTPEALPELQDFIAEKRETSDALSAYQHLEYASERIISRQVNREMCFIDKLTVKTHYPINNSEINAILHNLETDIEKKDLAEVKKLTNQPSDFLPLSTSKEFDNIVRPGKKNNLHFIYFCSHNDSYENNLDNLSRLSLATGCTVHSFNYPGVNKSTGHVDEKRDMIYAGLATISNLLSKGVNLDKIFLLSTSESYSIIKNIATQFLLRNLKINRVGIIDLSLEHNKRKFKPTALRKLLLYYNPNNVDLALNRAVTKEEKLMDSFNKDIFYNTTPKLFDNQKQQSSFVKLIKNFIRTNQQFLKQNADSQNPENITENIDVIKGEIQI